MHQKENLESRKIVSMVGPKHLPCCSKLPDKKDDQYVNVFKYLSSASGRHDREFRFCLKQYLLGEFKLQVINTPPYAGQFGNLPYQDPWWKALLCILALLLLVAAAIAEAVDGNGEISTTGGGGGAGSPTGDCCGLAPSGGGSGLLCSSGIGKLQLQCTTAAALSDAKDPFRRGQEATLPLASELTIYREC